MKPNEKGIALTMPSNTNLKTEPIKGIKPTTKNLTTLRNKFQYRCSFCACELLNDGLRFKGVGACPACNDLAHLWVDALRGYEANYANNLGVRK